MPFSSKGLADAHHIAINAAIERCWNWSEQGRLPIVIDTSPCTYGFRTARGYLTDDNQNRFDQMTFLDSIEFVHDTLLPKLHINSQPETVALHPVRSVTKLALTSKPSPEHTATKASSHSTPDATPLPAIADSCCPNSPPRPRVRK
jgi:D-lactate dehydrogenase